MVVRRRREVVRDIIMLVVVVVVVCQVRSCYTVGCDCWLSVLTSHYTRPADWPAKHNKLVSGISRHLSIIMRNANILCFVFLRNSPRHKTRQHELINNLYSPSLYCTQPRQQDFEYEFYGRCTLFS